MADQATTSPIPTRAEQQLWGLRYIDDAVMRRRAPIADFTSGALNWQASLWEGDSGKACDASLRRLLGRSADRAISIEVP